MHAPLQRLLLLCALLFALTAGPGCAARQAEVRLDVPTVLKVQIKGSKTFAASAIRSELAQRQTSVLHFIPPFTFFQPRYYLQGNDWRDDKKRILNFYSLRGFFDTEVLSTQIATVRVREDGDPKSVRVVHTVREGEPSNVRIVRINVVAPPGIKEEIHAQLVPELAFTPGTRFSMDAVQATEAAFVRRLQNSSYASAVTRSIVDAYPEESAVEVTFLVEPGPEAVFGEVTIEGLDKVRERYVRTHVFAKPGEPWRASDVERTKREIYGMGVFTMVTLVPDLEGPPKLTPGGALIVPVAITLRERKPRSVTYSPGLEWDVQGFTLLPLDLTFEHVNLGRRLLQASANIRAGYRYLSTSDHFPTAGTKLELRWPDFPARKLTLRGAIEAELGVERGYKFFTPGASVGLGISIIPGLQADLSYNLAFYDILPASWRIGPEPVVVSPCPEVGKAPGDCSPPSDAVAPEFDDNYLLSYTRESIVFDKRDNPLAANKGFMLQLASDQAFPLGRKPDGSMLGFRYIKLEADLRGYLPVVPTRVVVASRIGGAHIITWGDEHNLPVSKAVYLGGDGSVRGFRSRYLGPRAIEAGCTSNDCIVPLGARSAISGSVEVRFRPVGGLWLAGFTDFGRTWGDASTDSNVASESLLEYHVMCRLHALAALDRAKDD